MASSPALDQTKFLREKTEYLDALAAYEQTLNRVANGMLIPAATQANYGVGNGGYERAATDPWMVENHPDLSAAGARLAKEEREYRALDEPVASHAHNKCSISAYLGQKFYEYVSMAETVYKLATDEESRKQIATALGAAMESGGFLNDFFVMLGAGHGAQERAIAGLANRDIGLANEKLQKAQAEATSRTLSRIQSHFADKWQAFQQGWEECGIANAVAKAGLDGVFLAGEVVLGGYLAIKGIRFSYRLLDKGVHHVDIVSVEKGTLGGHSWTTEALEAKYGKPNENQVGGLLPDQNRTIKDGPAEPPEKAGDGAKAGQTGKYTQAQLDRAAEYNVNPKWIDADGNIRYPTAADGFPDGFDGPIESTTLKPGDIIDRYGSTTGKFFSTPGTSFEQRAMVLSNKYDNTPRVYRVLKEFPVQKGRIAPWFDQPGGGIQYLSEIGEKELAKDQFIEMVEDAPFR